MRRTDLRHRDSFFHHGHILAITCESLKPPLRVAKKLGAGLLEAFYPTIENVNNGLVQRNSPAYSGEAAALPPAGTSVKR